MTLEEVIIMDRESLVLVEQLLKRGRLTTVQEIVFRQSWTGQTYLDMAIDSDYDLGYIKDVGSELWRSLSQALGEKVTKSNLHKVLKRIIQEQEISNSKQQFNRHISILKPMAFSPDAQLLASGSNDHIVKVWHLATGKCVQTLEGHNACVWSVAFHPTEQILATASEDNTIKLWNLETGYCVQTLKV